MRPGNPETPSSRTQKAHVVLARKSWLIAVVILVGMGFEGTATAQIMQSGRAVLRVPTADGDLQAQYEQVKKLFTEGRLEAGYDQYRRLYTAGRDQLFKVPQDDNSDKGILERYVAGDIQIRSLLLNLTHDQRSACAERLAPQAARFEDQWLAGRARGLAQALEAGGVLRNEFPVTAAGRRALSRQAEALFERGAFSEAFDTWEYLVKMARPEEAGAPLGALNRARSLMGKPLLPPASFSLTQASLFDQPHGCRQAAPFKRGIKSWRTVEGIWPSFNQTPYMTYKDNPNYAVPFQGSVYVNDGVSTIAEFDMASGKMRHRFGYQPRQYLGVLAARVVRNPRTLLVTDRHVIGSFIVRIREASAYMNYAIKEPVPYRSVFVFSRHDRKLLWRSDAVPALEKVSVVGVPLLRNGILYVPGWVQQGFVNIFVTAVQVDTGKVLWQRMVCGSQVAGTMFGEMAVEPFALSLAASRSQLFLATHMGAVAGLDLNNGTIRWLTRYPSRDVVMGRGGYRIFQGQSWLDNPILYDGTSLWVAPRDSRRSESLLLALDAHNGQCRKKWAWPIRNAGGGFKYLLGRSGDAVYLADETTLRTVTLEHNATRTLYRMRHPGDKLLGRPALTRDGIYFCVQNINPKVNRSELRFLSFHDNRCKEVLPPGSSLDDFNSRHVLNMHELGNCWATDDALLISSGEFVTCFISAEKGAP